MIRALPSVHIPAQRISKQHDQISTKTPSMPSALTAVPRLHVLTASLQTRTCAVLFVIVNQETPDCCGVESECRDSKRLYLWVCPLIHCDVGAAAVSHPTLCADDANSDALVRTDLSSRDSRLGTDHKHNPCAKVVHKCGNLLKALIMHYTARSHIYLFEQLMQQDSLRKGLSRTSRANVSSFANLVWVLRILVNPDPVNHEVSREVLTHVL